MERVGRLAGGLAHDFNNILIVINGYAKLLMDRSKGDASVRQDLAEISMAAERGMSIAQQLLAIGRRQAISPRVLDLNEVAVGLHSFLSRLVGDDIRIDSDLAPDLGHVRADAGQIEQLLMNLAVNARDAMPGGGTLHIETSNAQVAQPWSRYDLMVEPGPYVRMDVRDTGSGMPPEVAARLFEPFFTTKSQGTGTGLGLAVVHAIIEQNRGGVEVESSPGRGTTFRVYLPCVDEALGSA